MSSLDVLGSTMHFTETGSGRTVLFLHGNPTSSYLWRDVLGPMAEGRRCLALDLIGMGRSAKPDLEYRLGDHRRYLDGFVDAAGLEDLVVVGHDWGAVLGIDLLARRPELVAGIAFLEGHLHPIESWADLDPGARELFGSIRQPGTGERLVLDENVFLEQVLPSGINRRLSADETAAYHQPFGSPEERRPILQWVREIPIAGEPADVVAVVERNQRVLASPPVPKLLLHGTPGAVVGAAEVAWCRQNCPALTIADVGPGTHFLPEDQPGAIAAALNGWLPSVP